MLTFSFILLLSSLFKIQPEQPTHFFQQSIYSNNGWAYSGIAIAVALIISIFILLLKEITVNLKIVEDLKMQWEHSRISIGNMSEGLIINAQEKERRFIGQELHDNVNQLLASSLLTLGVVKHYQADQEKVNEFADVTKEHIQNALNEIRKLSHELVPAAFDGSTLKDIFESLLSEINVENQFCINFQFNDKINALIGEDLQINLYRILQEQVKNILKYADASQIDLTVCCNEKHVTMRTYDNGKGFDPRKVKAGIGLCNMRRRVESFGGKFNIISQPGKGCEIVVEIPTKKGLSASN